MTYSVITLSYNKLACTRRCLSALLTDSVADGPWELIVVDNGSTDGSYEWCATGLADLGAARGVPVTVLRNDGNIGCSFSRNRAIAAARGEYLAFADNDIAPRTRRWLPGLREALAATPREDGLPVGALSDPVRGRRHLEARTRLFPRPGRPRRRPALQPSGVRAVPDQRLPDDPGGAPP